jgi:hypothetical protein
MPTHPLEKIIRRLDPGWPPAQLDPDERLVLLDVATGKTLDKKPLLSLREIRGYLVNTQRNPVECEGPVCSIKSPETRLAMDVACRYEARCEKGDEKKLVAALARGDHAAALVDRFIADRVVDFVAGETAVGRDVCVDFLTLRGPLQAFIADRARSELGLILEVQVHPRPDPDRDLTAIPVRTELFPARVCDQDDQVEIRLATELEIDLSRRMRAVLFHHQSGGLEEAVRQVVRRVLADETTLHAFTYELTTTVRRRLLEAVNQRLAEEGRRISFLQLESRAGGDPAAGLGEIERAVTCKIADCTESIVVRHRLQLSLCDLGRFRSAGVGDLRTWVTERLEEITRDVLFDRRYLDLLLSFAPDEAQIKSRMEREVARIGYTVRQLVTAPALEPLRWREGLAIPDVDETFATFDSRIDVGLVIVVHGKIVDLRHPNLQRYLVPHSRLVDDVREAVLRETRRIMHRISPERFYMRFAYSDVAGEEAVRELLEGQLSALLAERFAIEDLSVTVKPKETELTRRLERLQRGLHTVEVTCTPLNRSGEEVTYRIDFDVLGVAPDGWYLFLAKGQPPSPEGANGARQVRPEEVELGRIREVIAEDVKSKVQIAPREILQFADLGRYRDLIEVLQQSVRRKVESVFGLVVRIINMNRLATFGEQRRGEAVAHAITTSLETGEKILEQKKSDLKLLYEKRSGMLKSDLLDMNDETVAFLEGRISALEKEVAPDQLGRGQDEVKVLFTDAAALSPADEWKRMAMGAPALSPPSEQGRLTEHPQDDAQSSDAAERAPDAPP